MTLESLAQYNKNTEVLVLARFIPCVCFMHMTKHVRLDRFLTELETAQSSRLKPCLKYYTASWPMEILL